MLLSAELGSMGSRARRRRAPGVAAHVGDRAPPTVQLRSAARQRRAEENEPTSELITESRTTPVAVKSERVTTVRRNRSPETGS